MIRGCRDRLSLNRARLSAQTQCQGRPYQKHHEDGVMRASMMGPKPAEPKNRAWPRLSIPA